MNQNPSAVHPSSFSLHPSIKSAPNKPISPPTEVPHETYASAKPLPIEPATTNSPHPLGNKLKTAADGRGIT